MAFSIKLRPERKVYRVGGAATKIRIAQVNLGSDRGIWGLSKAISSAIYRLLGIPHNAPQLVALRKRVLRAIANSGTVIDPTPPQYLPPVEPTGASPTFPHS